MFLDEDSRHGSRIARVKTLCAAVREYVLGRVSSPATGHLDPEAVRRFLQRLSDVLGRCDENISDAPFQRKRNAFVHLVDRYRWFWDILEELLRARELPIRRTALDVLDVGTGPAPALYAVNDFLEELRAFAQRCPAFGELLTPFQQLRSIEASRSMVARPKSSYHFVQLSPCWGRGDQAPILLGIREAARTTGDSRCRKKPAG